MLHICNIAQNVQETPPKKNSLTQFNLDESEAKVK